jgi:hypothetical protein
MYANRVKKNFIGMRKQERQDEICNNLGRTRISDFLGRKLLPASWREKFSG